MNARLTAVVVLTLLSATLAARQGPASQQTRDPSQSQQQGQEPLGAIWGVVVAGGASGHPVDRVRLTLSGESGRGGRTVYTDDDGRFVFRDLAPGAYLLRGSKSGYVAITYGQSSPNAGRAGTPIQVAAGQQIENLSFVLPPGGVITGTVLDERSRPAVGTDVRVMRWEYDDGHRELSSAGSARTDDRGIYRVYGLPPGDYIVSALPRNVDQQRIEMSTVSRPTTASAPGLLLRDQSATPVPIESDAPVLGYAPTYYPGAVDIGAAMAVEVGVSSEVMGVDVLLQEVPLARVQGTVMAPPGVDARSMRVRLNHTRIDVPGVGNGSARVRDGRFEFTDVAPGQYRAVATAEIDTDDAGVVLPAIAAQALGQGDDEILLWGAADVSVGGSDVTHVAVALGPGVAVSGRMTYDGAGARPEAQRIRVTLEPFGPADEAAGANDARATVDANGLFTITGVIPGRYRVEASGASGWEVASARLGGVDAMDVGLDVAAAGQNVAGLEVVFSDQRTEITGMLQNALGAPASGYTVVVFPSERGYWLPGARRIQATRPSTAGRFSFSGLPPGDYRLAAVTDVENGIWFDPAVLQQFSAASIPFTLQKGQTLTQNLRVGGGG